MSRCRGCLRGNTVVQETGNYGAYLVYETRLQLSVYLTRGDQPQLMRNEQVEHVLKFANCKHLFFLKDEVLCFGTLFAHFSLKNRWPQ